jgi:hypothetical protein
MPGRGVNHSRKSSAEVKERVELFFYSSCGPSRPVVGRVLQPIQYAIILFNYVVAFP